MTIKTPPYFSSLKQTPTNTPAVFSIQQDSSGLVTILINGFERQMIGSVIDVNVSDYFKIDIDPKPISPKPATEIEAYNGMDIGRMVSAQIYVNGDPSEVSYLVESAVPQLPVNRFLTDLKIRPHVEGQVDELSAVSNSLSPTLGVSLLDSLSDSPDAPVVESGDGAQYKVFAIDTTKRFALLVNSDGEILDRIEFVNVDSCSGIRLCWINKYGALDYWNFSRLVSESTSVSKTKIYSKDGYLTTEVSAEDEVSISTKYLNSQTLKALEWLLSSERVWIVKEDGSYEEIDVTTTSATTYSEASPTAFQVTYRPKIRRI